jgi:hypothetical protein
MQFRVERAMPVQQRFVEDDRGRLTSPARASASARAIFDALVED